MTVITIAVFINYRKRIILAKETEIRNIIKSSKIKKICQDTMKFLAGLYGTVHQYYINHLTIHVIPHNNRVLP
jgi:hypothetical protein